MKVVTSHPLNSFKCKIHFARPFEQTVFVSLRDTSNDISSAECMLSSSINICSLRFIEMMWNRLILKDSFLFTIRVFEWNHSDVLFVIDDCAFESIFGQVESKTDYICSDNKERKRLCGFEPLFCLCIYGFPSY